MSDSSYTHETWSIDAFWDGESRDGVKFPKKCNPDFLGGGLNFFCYLHILNFFLRKCHHVGSPFIARGVVPDFFFLVVLLAFL